MRQLLLLTAISCWCSAHTQVWCPPSAHWTFDFESFTSVGYTRFTNVGDTVVAGQACQKVLHEWDRYDYPTMSFLSADVATYISSTIGDVALIWDGATFDTLYNFGASPGDHWNLANDGSVPEDYLLEVADTGSAMVSGTLLRWLLVNVEGMVMQDTIFERIGSRSIYWIPWMNASLDGFGGPLRCYSDGELDFHTGISPDCDFILTADASSPEPAITISPNPGSASIQLHLPRVSQDWTIAFLDLTGRIMDSFQCTGGQLSYNTALLASGVYVLRMSTPTGVHHVSQWIKL